MNHQERAVIQAHYRNTESWLDPDGKRRWIRVQRITPSVVGMVAKGWLRLEREDANGTVYLVTRCGQERSEAMRAERDAPRGKVWQR